MENKAIAGENKVRLKWYEWLWALLPLALLTGGAIGGACGGVAASFNVKLFKEDRSIGRKYFFTGLVTFGAVLGYIILATIFLTLADGPIKG